MAYSEDEIEVKFRLILDSIEEGNSLRKTLLSEGMPDSRTFYKWIDKDEEKLLQYARATELRADNIFEEILNISDATENDVILDGEGNPITNHNVIQRDRLRVDSRKWMAGKMNPKKYGDKMQQDINIKTEQPLFGDE